MGPYGITWKVQQSWVKCDSHGNLECYKAYLVAKEFTQKDGINYMETFSPVSKKDSFRIIMTLAALYDLELHQIDVKIVFSEWEFRQRCLYGSTNGVSN